MPGGYVPTVRAVCGHVCPLPPGPPAYRVWCVYDNRFMPVKAGDSVVMRKLRTPRRRKGDMPSTLTLF